MLGTINHRKMEIFKVHKHISPCQLTNNSIYGHRSDDLDLPFLNISHIPLSAFMNVADVSWVSINSFTKLIS